MNEPLDLRDFLKQTEQLGLAVVAAVGCVRREGRIGQLRRLDFDEPEAKRGGELASGDCFAVRVRIGRSEHRLTPVAEDNVCGERQQCRVDASGVRDEHTVELLESLKQRLVLLGRRHETKLLSARAGGGRSGSRVSSCAPARIVRIAGRGEQRVRQPVEERQHAIVDGSRWRRASRRDAQRGAG